MPKAKSYSRMDRVGDMIQNTLAGIIQGQARDHQLGITTVTRVVVTKDLGYANVHISVLPEDKSLATVASLNRLAKHLRYTLAHQIRLRVVPELRFYYDDTTLRGSRISALLTPGATDDQEL